MQPSSWKSSLQTSTKIEKDLGKLERAMEVGREDRGRLSERRHSRLNSDAQGWRRAVSKDNFFHTDCSDRDGRNMSRSQKQTKDLSKYPASTSYSKAMATRQNALPPKGYETPFLHRLRGIHKVKNGLCTHEIKSLAEIKLLSGWEMCHSLRLDGDIFVNNKWFTGTNLRQIHEDALTALEIEETPDAALCDFGQFSERDNCLNIGACCMGTKRYSKTKRHGGNKLPKIPQQKRSLGFAFPHPKKLDSRKKLHRSLQTDRNFSSVPKVMKNESSTRNEYSEKTLSRRKLPRIPQGDQARASASKKMKSPVFSESGGRKAKKTRAEQSQKESESWPAAKDSDPLKEIRTVLKMRRHKSGWFGSKDEARDELMDEDAESLFRFTAFVCPGGFLYFVPGIFSFKHCDYDRWAREPVLPC